MQAHEVRQHRWNFKLAPQLTGEAQQAYAALSVNESQDYEALKAAISRRYNKQREIFLPVLRGKTKESRELTGTYHPPHQYSQEVEQEVFDL